MKSSIRTGIQLLSLAAMAALAIYLAPKYSNPFKYHFEEGQPWVYGIVRAEFDFPIYKTESQLQHEKTELLKQYTPCFTLDPIAEQTNILVLSKEDHARLEKDSVQQVNVITSRHATKYDFNNLHTPKTAYQTFHKDLSPNLIYDSITSETMRNSLLENLSLTHGLVHAGEMIVNTGEIITPNTYQLLVSLRHAMQSVDTSKRNSAMSMFGVGACVVMLLVIFYFYLYTYRRKLLDNLRNMFFFTILMTLVISVSFLVIQYAPVGYVYIIPFAWCPIIARVFYDSRTAIFLHIITILIVSLAVPAPYMFLLVQMLAGIIAVISLKDMTQRAQLAKTAAFIFLAYVLLYSAVTLMISGDYSDINYKYYLYFAINAVLVICAYGLIFLFERGFGLLSNITLVELTNINSNLMLEFAEKAPGTFQHSLQVSNLATEAAKRIGAKVLLVRTGALYHDIGKMSHPEYFIENQAGVNPLQSMPYDQAAKVILEHVTEGERIARKHHLPELIVHFIRSHHGNSVTRYFYNSAVNDAKNKGLSPDSVNRDDYAYPGPKPATKEAAILMMADAIEARSRSLSSLTEESIALMVDQMIDAQVADGQFSDTLLSFKDLEDIRAVFKQKLLEINHHRIVYPTIDESNVNSKS